MAYKKSLRVRKTKARPSYRKKRVTTYRKSYRPARSRASMSDQFLLTRSIKQPFPARQWVRLEYSATVNPLSDNSNHNLCGHPVAFSLGNPNSPDISLSPYTPLGTKPWAWTTLGSIYNAFLVDAVDIEVEFVLNQNILTSTSSTPCLTVPTLFCAVQLASTRSYSNMYGKTQDAIRQEPFTVVKDIVCTGSQRSKVKFSVKPYQILGVTRLQYYSNPTEYAAINGSSPGDYAVMNCAVGCMNQDTEIDNVECRIKLCYRGQCYDRNTVVA